MGKPPTPPIWEYEVWYMFWHIMSMGLYNTLEELWAIGFTPTMYTMVMMACNNTVSQRDV